MVASTPAIPPSPRIRENVARIAATAAQCSAPSPARSRSDLLGPVAVGVGDYFHHVTVGVLEIDDATDVQMIDLAGLGAPRIGVILDSLRADAGERRVELDIADMSLSTGVRPLAGRSPAQAARFRLSNSMLGSGSTTPEDYPQ